MSHKRYRTGECFCSNFALREANFSPRRQNIYVSLYMIWALVFCLMSKISKACYDQLFFNLRKICLEQSIILNPVRIISDFEKPICSSAKAFFPQASFKSCLFHFGQILWRKVQKNNMAAKYGNSEAFSMKVQMIKSLAFLPANEVSAYYSSLSSDDESDLNQLGAWFEKNYIGGVNTRPKYKPEF